jgi:hypothetical protein
MKMTFPKWKVEGNENLLKLCTKFTGCPEAIDLLTQMMQLEPSKRISVKGALAHPFFAEFQSGAADAEMTELVCESVFL